MPVSYPAQIVDDDVVLLVHLPALFYLADAGSQGDPGQVEAISPGVAGAIAHVEKEALHLDRRALLEESLNQGGLHRGEEFHDLVGFPESVALGREVEHLEHSSLKRRDLHGKAARVEIHEPSLGWQEGADGDNAIRSVVRPEPGGELLAPEGEEFGSALHGEVVRLAIAFSESGVAAQVDA